MAPKAFDRHRPDSPSNNMISCHREDADGGCRCFPFDASSCPDHRAGVSRAKLKFFKPVANFAKREKHVDILVSIIM